MTEAGLIRVIADNGLGVCAAGVLFVLFLRSQTALQVRYDKLLERILGEIRHGDGNGAPSLAKLDSKLDSMAATIDDHGRRLSAVEERCRRNHATEITDLTTPRRRRATP